MSDGSGNLPYDPFSDGFWNFDSNQPGNDARSALYADEGMTIAKNRGGNIGVDAPSITEIDHWDAWNLGRMHSMANNLDSASMHALAQDWRTLGSQHAQSWQDLHQKITSRIGDSWTGASADAAKSKVATVAGQGRDLGSAMTLHGDKTEENATAAEQTRLSMPEPTVTPPARDMILGGVAALMTGSAPADAKAELDQVQAKQQDGARVLRTVYQQVYVQTDRNTPAFHPAAAAMKPASKPSGKPQPGPGPGRGKVQPPAVRPGPVNPPPEVFPPSTPEPKPQSWQPPKPLPYQQPGQSGPSGWSPRPVPTSGPGPGQPASVAPPQVPGSSGGGTTAAGWTPPGTPVPGTTTSGWTPPPNAPGNAGWSPDGSGGYGSGWDFGPTGEAVNPLSGYDSAGPGYGAGGYRMPGGAGASAEYGAGGRAGGPGGVGAGESSWGGRAGSGAGGSAEAEAARAAGPGAEAAAAEAEGEGRPGMAGPMGGAGKGEKDKERKTPGYLRNDRNTLDVVGDMPPNVVPVVGDPTIDQQR